MKIQSCVTKKDINKLIKFKRELYKEDVNFKNNDEILLKEVISKKSSFNNENYVEPILVTKNDIVIGGCVIIHAPSYKNFVQIAFIDFIEEDGCDIVANIIEYARKKAIDFNAEKIVIGLNGHVNYGLGILISGFNHKQSFGGIYNKEYYGKIIERFSPDITYLDSFSREMSGFDISKYDKIIQRANNKFTYRYLNKKDLKTDSKIYNELNNIIFKEHSFYYQRSEKSDYELFKDLSYLIKDNHLIFAYKDNEPVGFLLWYPDYNELLKKKEYFSLHTILKNKLFAKYIKKCKIAEIGVLPKYKNSGVIMGLFNEFYKITKDRYHFVESSWILATNFKSRNFGVKFDANEYKKFAVYEIDVKV